MFALEVCKPDGLRPAELGLVRAFFFNRAGSGQTQDLLIPLCYIDYITNIHYADIFVGEMHYGHIIHYT